ncbi:MAG: hypothetical protein AAFV53_08125 [Myxococcota bacterium]
MRGIAWGIAGLLSVHTAPATAGTPAAVDVALQQVRDGNYFEAISTLDDALLVTPEDDGVRILRAYVLGWSGRFRESRAAWNRMLEHNTNEAGLYVGRANLALAEGRRAAARADLEQARRHQPDHPELNSLEALIQRSSVGELQAGPELWWLPDEAPIAGAFAAGIWRPRSWLSTHAQWRSSAPANAAQPGDDGWVSQATGTTSLKTRHGVAITAGISHLSGDTRWTGTPVELSLSGRAGWVSAAARPGWSEDGRTDHRVGLGIGLKLHEHGWTQLQGLRWSESTGASADSLVWSIGATPRQPDRLRADLSVTRDALGVLGTSTFSWEHDLGRYHGFTLQGEGIIGRFTRAGGAAHWRVRF